MVSAAVLAGRSDFTCLFNLMITSRRTTRAYINNAIVNAIVNAATYRPGTGAGRRRT